MLFCILYIYIYLVYFSDLQLSDLLARPLVSLPVPVCRGVSVCLGGCVSHFLPWFTGGLACKRSLWKKKKKSVTHMHA